jgi:hypothetical protein
MALRPAFIIVFAAALILSIFTVQYSEDVCIHAVLVEQVKLSPLSPDYYQPLDIRFTYPPLFHYLAYSITLFNVDILTATRIAGVLALSVFSAGCYLLAEKRKKRSGIYAGVFSLASGAVWQVFLFGEFPQLLATGLLASGLAFSKKPYLSGFFFGLTSLSHPLIGLIGLLFAFFLAFRDRKPAILATCIPLFAMWSGRYLLIAQNALAGSWGNSAGASGFISPAILALSLLLLSPALVILAAYHAYILLRRNVSGILDPLLILLTATFILSVFQVAPLQRKMFDLLALPVIVLAAGEIHRVRKHRMVIWTLIAVFAVLPLHQIHMHTREPYVTPEGLVQAALFLKNYDDKGFIVVAEERRWYGKSELIASQLAGKTPMDLSISMLEKPTPAYLSQLEYRKKMIEGYVPDTSVYIVSKYCSHNVIYENGQFRVCLTGYNLPPDST